MRTLWTIAAAAVSLANLGCFVSPPTGLEDLGPPVLVWGQGQGFCSKDLAVDGVGTVWLDQGCETPVDYERIRTVTAAQMDDLWTMFYALPLGQSASSSCVGLVQGFSRWVPDSSQRTGASVCAGQVHYDDLSGLPPEFLPLAEAMVALQ